MSGTQVNRGQVAEAPNIAYLYDMIPPRNLRLAVVLAALVLAAPAAAQERSDNVSGVTVDISLDSGNIDADDQQYTVNLDNCQDLASDSDTDLVFAWTMQTTPADGAQFSIKVREGSEVCNTDSLVRETTDECITVFQQEDFSSTSIRVTIDEDQVFEFLDSETNCDAPESQIDVILIFSGYAESGSDDDDDDDAVRFIFDTIRPSAPTGLTVAAGESTLAASWSTVAGAESYTVF